MTMHEIRPIRALHDNYIWMIVHPDLREAVIVDPGEAKPVLDALDENEVKLKAILITHHHWDHTNGIADLLNHFSVPVYAPANDNVSLCDHPLREGDTIDFEDLGWQFSVMDIPGHTLGHIALVGLGCVFSGDTLFTGGCGRVFEGTPDQMLASLNRFKDLPADTRVYCGHEYTKANLQFALKVEPENADLIQRMEETKALRAKDSPTVPSTMAVELATNPFLRCETPTVKQAAEQHLGHQLESPVEVFSAIREWKNSE